MAELVVSDVEGTLTTGAMWRGVGRYLVAHGRALAYRAFFLARLPQAYLARFRLIAEQPFKDRWVRDLAGLLRGFDVDALAHMADWVVEHELWPTRRQRVLAELGAHARGGRRVALLSGIYQPILEVFARRIGAEAYGTALELRDGTATGKVVEINSGVAKSARLGEIGRGDALVAAYGDTEADVSMLELAAEPVAVSPDRGLLRVALARGWRIVSA